MTLDLAFETFVDGQQRRRSPFRIGDIPSGTSLLARKMDQPANKRLPGFLTDLARSVVKSSDEEL